MATMSQRTKFPYHKTLLLGIVISILGIACILEAIIALTLNTWGSYVGTGLWCGLVIFIAGVTGIISSHFRGEKSVKCYFICSALATVMSLVMVVMSAAGLDFSSNFYNNASYFRKNNKRLTFYCYVAALTFSLLSLVGNMSALFFCVQHNSFYYQKNRKKKTKSSRRRSSHGNYFRASTNSRSTLQDRERNIDQQPTSIQPTEPSEQIQNKDRNQTLEKKKTDSSKRSKHKRINSDSRGARSKSKDDANATAQKDDKRIKTEAPVREYRSLPNRSKRHGRQTSCKVEVNREVKELLPTHFHEDELPSYEEAMCLPKLQQTNPKGFTVNNDIDDSPTDGLSAPSITLASYGRRASSEHSQNLQNEEFEMSRRAPSGLATTPQYNAQNLNNFIETTNSLENEHEIRGNKNVTSSQINKFDRNTRSMIGSEGDRNQQEFNLNTSQNVGVGATISIGSPRSAFTPVKRRASQRASNDIQEAETSNLNMASSSSQNSINGNVWKNIVLPSVLRTEDIENESDGHVDSLHPSGINVMPPLHVYSAPNNEHVSDNNQPLLYGNRDSGDHEDNVPIARDDRDSSSPVNQPQPPPPVRGPSSDTHFYSQIL